MGRSSMSYFRRHRRERKNKKTRQWSFACWSAFFCHGLFCFFCSFVRVSPIFPLRLLRFLYLVSLLLGKKEAWRKEGTKWSNAKKTKEDTMRNGKVQEWNTGKTFAKSMCKDARLCSGVALKVTVSLTWQECCYLEVHSSRTLGRSSSRLKSLQRIFTIARLSFSAEASKVTLSTMAILQRMFRTSGPSFNSEATNVGESDS